MDSVDALVMGSGSLRTVLGFGEWPYQKPVIVLSSSMTKQDLPENLHDKIEFSTESPESLWSTLGALGYMRIYVDGGAIIRSFLKAGLVQDIKITMVPILLGDGIRIFGETEHDVDLELISAKPFPSGLVTLHYDVKST